MPTSGKQEIIKNKEKREFDLEMGEIDSDIVRQRITNIITTKYKDQILATQKPREQLVLAMNLREIEGDFESARELLFGFETVWSINSNKEKLERKNIVRRNIRKGNKDRLIPVGYFRKDQFGLISAALLSNDCVGCYPQEGFEVIHNPFATYPIKIDVFSFCDQWYLEGNDVLRKVPASHVEKHA